MATPPGVFVSSVMVDDWTDDPDVPGTEMHELVRTDGVWAGMTRIVSTDGPLSWIPDKRETVHVLEGSVRIEFELGPPLVLRAGDLASFPAGIPMQWHVSTPFKELWFMA